MIRGSDGLDYEDLAHKLIGEPAKTHRNNSLIELRGEEFFDKACQELFDRRYDSFVTVSKAGSGHYGEDLDWQAAHFAHDAVWRYRQELRRAASTLVAAPQAPAGRAG